MAGPGHSVSTTGVIVGPRRQLAVKGNDMRVVVVGGGIGGVALAAGLRRRGFEVTAFDRDTEVAATGGYHITLDERAQSALRELVAPEIMERLLASASALRLRDRDAFWDHRGRVLGHGPDLSSDAGVDIDRITLRTLLAEAVGDDLFLGQTVSGVGHDEDGRPQVRFTDAAPVTADLVVGADGTHSLVARHLAGGPTNSPAGIIGFSGRTSRGDLSPREQHRLGPRSGLAIGPRGAALYVGFLDPVGNAVLDAPELRMSVTTGPTYIWGGMFPESAATDALRGLRDGENADGAQLPDLTDVRSARVEGAAGQHGSSSHGDGDGEGGERGGGLVSQQRRTETPRTGCPGEGTVWRPAAVRGAPGRGMGRRAPGQALMARGTGQRARPGWRHTPGREPVR
ncbi:FAD-dependent oxidoreductase [Streptomyces yokosukanensis]|uniref:FAD-dependent oxidoreductase n=1 Tax=Streptomyces yokosukanensis TaxID=67386 RepID=UPI001ABFF44D|nr:FAD-dependent monooxygenase [Streptomyces yokosukanensis]